MTDRPGLGRHRFATIDVGSNSVLLHVADRQEDGTFVTVHDELAITRLGEGLHDTGKISTAAADRSAAALARFEVIVDELGVEETAAVGTMCLRTARNAKAFIRRVADDCGLKIEVISGEEEARLSYLAATSTLDDNPGRVAVFDVGGGSTEFIFGDRDGIDRRFSLDVGIIRLTEDFLRSDPVTPAELSAMREALKRELAPIPRDRSVETVVGAGGTLTTMAAVLREMTTYDPTHIQGAVLSAEEVERQIALYRALPIVDRRDLPGLHPQRADVILAGAAIVSAVLSALGASEVLVSDRGVRHGLMADRFA